jgi:hypothetical protein
MRHRTRTAAAGFLAVGLLLTSMPSASARIVEREPWAFSESFDDEVCGIEVEIDVEAQGLFMIRQQRPGSPVFLASNVSEFREVVTDPETGAWFVVRGRHNFREVTATQVDGDVHLFRWHIAGQPFVIEDRHGKVVYRDSGLEVLEALFDTLGDDAPGGDLISVELVARRGFPGYLEDVCPIVEGLLR